jgi:outer membrane lipoprotein SlyB
MAKRVVMKKRIAMVLLSVVALTGCARQGSSDVYSGAHVGESSKTYPGVIISARMVTIEDKSMGQTPLGTIAGGIVGGIAGSQVGKGKGQSLATVGGVVGGAVAGSHVESSLKTREAMEYVVALENGDSMAVVQDPKPLLNVGQKVWLITGQEGRARVVPRQE